MQQDGRKLRKQPQVLPLCNNTHCAQQIMSTTKMLCSNPETACCPETRADGLCNEGIPGAHRVTRIPTAMESQPGSRLSITFAARQEGEIPEGEVSNSVHSSDSAPSAKPPKAKKRKVKEAEVREETVKTEAIANKVGELEMAKQAHEELLMTLQSQLSETNIKLQQVEKKMQQVLHETEEYVSKAEGRVRNLQEQLSTAQQAGSEVRASLDEKTQLIETFRKQLAEAETMRKEDDFRFQKSYMSKWHWTFRKHESRHVL